MSLPLYDVSTKPSGCSGCEYSKSETGFVPCWTAVGPRDAKVAFLGERPGQNELLEREPFVGGTGKLLMKCIERAGYTRRDVLLDNVLRCGNSTNFYPIGHMRKLAEASCRQYDDVGGLALNKPGLRSFNPDTILLSLHPAVALRTWTLVRVIESDVAKAFRLYESGRRVLVCLGDKAASLILPDLDLGIMKSRGSWFDWKWGEFESRTGRKEIKL